MSLRYFLGAIISFPFLPILYFEGKKIRKQVPKLPEAKNPEGYIKNKSNRTLKVIAIGESTFAGVGVDIHENGFIGALVKEIARKHNLSVLWKVYAKSGFTARKVHKTIIPNITETNADLIVIGLGGNDAFKLNSPDFWGLQINLIIKKLNQKFPDTPIYFTNMPPIKEFPAFTRIIKFVIGNLVELLGKKLNAIVKRKNKVYYNNELIKFDTWQNRYKIKGDINSFFSDGVHPSFITYQTWGKDMANYILNTRSFKQWMQNQ
ncbi:MAG: SGNH/GDSL hydrolase family protein [Flavobacteriaceae bacterium]|nr:SGNH/GDSL hydrolase family protein [Flavobacteriaceae bacterium]